MAHVTAADIIKEIENLESGDIYRFGTKRAVYEIGKVFNGGYMIGAKVFPEQLFYHNHIKTNKDRYFKTKQKAINRVKYLLRAK